MEPDALSNQSKSRKWLKERIKALFLHQNKTLPENELDKLADEMTLYQQELEKRSFDLAERVKELNCLYNLSLLIEKPGITREELMQSLVELVPDSWQYPEITCARIIYDEKAFKTANFQETPWKQSASISVNNEKKGALELFLLEEKPEMDEGPFLKEERDLIDTLARNLGRYLERNTMEKALRDSEENQRVTLQSLGDAVIATDTNGQIIRMNPVAEELTGWKFSEAENRPIDEVFRIVNAITGMKAEDPVTKVLETGKIVGLANHTKLISKNGQEYQIADSGAPITGESGKTIGVVLVFRDVTEEYKTHQELKDNEIRFKAIVEGAPDPIFIQSDMKFAYLNPAACRLFGVESAEELVGTPVMNRFHPAYYEKIKQRIKALNQDIQSVRELFKQKFIRMDGSEVWVETAGEPIIYSGKNSALVFVRDISQRVEDEEAIREHQRELESMVGNLPGFVYRCKYDKNWTMLYLSKQFEKITGYPSADFIHNAKRTYNQIIEKDFQPEIFRKWEKAIAGKSVFEAEYPVLTRNNQIKWIWERGTGVFDENGNVLFLEGYIEDITQRKEMEQEIKEGEKKYRRITENISDVVWTTDLNFKTIYISPSVELLLGETTEEHVKKSLDERLPPESLKTVQRIIADEMEKEKNPESDKSRTRKVEIQHYKADGTLVWVEMNNSFIRNEKGEIIGYQGVTRDISERKKAETELKRKVEELERFNRLMVGRENRMIELKQEINELLEKLGQNKKYQLPDETEKS